MPVPVANVDHGHHALDQGNSELCSEQARDLEWKESCTILRFLRSPENCREGNGRKNL